MARYSTPGTYFTENDNSVRSAVQDERGTGAIVIKANKGYVNQRVKVGSLSDFISVFGEAEELDDYGHFGAENFLSTSNNLLVVRATMGDEKYAQVQFPYEDAEKDDVFHSEDVGVFKFVDNNETSQLVLCDPLETVMEVSSLVKDEWEADEFDNRFYLSTKAKGITFNDVFTKDERQVAVFKNEDKLTMSEDGVRIRYVSVINEDGSIPPSSFKSFSLLKSAWESSDKLPKSLFSDEPTDKMYEGIKTAWNLTGDEPTTGEETGEAGYKINLTIPDEFSLNGEVTVELIVTESIKGEIYPTDDSTEFTNVTWKELFSNSSFYGSEESRNLTNVPEGAEFEYDSDIEFVTDLEITLPPDVFGKQVVFANNVDKYGNVISMFDKLVFTEESWNSEEKLNKNLFTIGKIPYTGVSSNGFKVNITVPKTETLNNQNVNVSLWVTEEVKEKILDSDITWSELFDDSSFYKAENTDVTYLEIFDIKKINFLDWDDCKTKTHYVRLSDIEDTTGEVVGISFREYGLADNMETLVYGEETDTHKYELISTTGTDSETIALVKEIAEEYGIENIDITSEKYKVLKYIDAFAGYVKDDIEDANSKFIYKLIFTDSFKENKDLFWVYSKKDSNKISIESVYMADKPEPIVFAWQEGMVKPTADLVDPNNNKPINNITAFPTSEVLSDVSGKYKDGYTMTIDSDDEVGNGDIERYTSNKNNQLIICSHSPGEFGNDIGVSIITTDCADIPALNHQNAFNWKYKYDDADLVDADSPLTDFTWKKVYRINVYVKSKSQTAESAWGSGTDALLKDPIESWYVSNDPRAKDSEGNSLFAPNVINGRSEFIYVSRSSVNSAMTNTGEFAKPIQTYSIYGLTGGANSKKNNISEKTSALKLYEDARKAEFDFLFNVEAIDTFNGRQRFASHQNEIARIVGDRKTEIALVQVTSKEARTIRRKISEAKQFSFKNASYVAQYAGYDKYYSSSLSSWVYLPKSVAGAVVMGNVFRYHYVWNAPAGIIRGTIDYTRGQLGGHLSDDEIGQLYNINVNTSRNTSAYGESLHGQKTALKKNSVLNRINVRNLVNYIKKETKNITDPFVFSDGTENNYSALQNIIFSFLGRIESAGGLRFKNVKVIEDPKEENSIIVLLTIRPTESIEFIEVRLNITRSGITSSEENVYV